MNYKLATVLLSLTLSGVPAATLFPPFIYSTSKVCSTSFDPCDQDQHSGNPASSGLLRNYAYPGYINLGVNASMTIDEGVWRAQAGVGGSLNLFGGAVSYDGFATGTEFDNLTIPAGAYMVLPIHLTGNVLAEYSAVSNLAPGSTISALVIVNYDCQVNGFENGNYLPGSLCSQQLSFTNTQTVDQIIQLKIPFVAGQTFTLELQPSVAAYLSATVLGGTGGASGPFLITGQARGDFSHTAVVQAAQIYDANGNLIPNVPITAASGFNFNSPPGAPLSTTTPEPRSALLLAGGLAVFALLRKKS